MTDVKGKLKFAGEVLGEGKEAAEGGIFFWRMGKKTLKSLADWLKTSNSKIIILGCSGVGKSQLHGKLTDTEPDGELSSVGRSGDYRLQDYIFKVTETPGHEIREAERAKWIKRVEDAKRLVIVNVVANGYHFASMTAERKAELVDPEKLFQSCEKYRQAELERLDELNQLLARRESPTEVITFINKADLWWKGEFDSEVMARYEEGPYAGAVKTQNHFVHRGALDVKPYMGVVPMSGLYSDARRRSDLDAFTETLFSCLTR